MSFVPELQNVTAGNSISLIAIAVDEIVVKTCSLLNILIAETSETFALRVAS